MSATELFEILDRMAAREREWRHGLETSSDVELANALFELIDRVEDDALSNRLGVAFEIVLSRFAPKVLEAAVAS